MFSQFSQLHYAAVGREGSAFAVGMGLIHGPYQLQDHVAAFRIGVGMAQAEDQYLQRLTNIVYKHKLRVRSPMVVIG